MAREPENIERARDKEAEASGQGGSLHPLTVLLYAGVP